MNRDRFQQLERAALATLVLTFLGASDVLARQNDPPFDFSAAFYRANGIEPTAIVGRPDGTGENSVVDEAPDADHRDVRILQLTAAFDHSGHPVWFYVLGLVFEDRFTADDSGEEAREIAEEFVIYEFPRAGLPAQQPGIFFASDAEQNTPFLDGRLCLAGPKIRFGPPAPAGANGVLQRAIDLDAPPALGEFVPGSTWGFQTWYRDPAAGGSGANLSHALRITFE